MQLQRVPAVLITGASGYIGFDVLCRILDQSPGTLVYALVRDRSRMAAMLAPLGPAARRVRLVQGDLCRAGLGLSTADRAMLSSRVTQIVHSGADVAFTRQLSESRDTNTSGTSRILELADECVDLRRLLYVSTAFVAGRRTGAVRERDNGADCGWVNAYEQSKYEAEALVRASRHPWSIARPATVVCDAPGGAVRQIGASHHAVRLWRDGLVPMMPAASDATVDVVPLDLVAQGIVDLLRHPAGVGATVHLCAGATAMRVADIMDLAWRHWSQDDEWRGRRVARPALVDLATYRLFEEAVLDTGDPLSQRIVRSLSTFAPTLSYPKCFDTEHAERMLHMVPAPAEALWRTVFRHVAATPRTRATA